MDDPRSVHEKKSGHDPFYQKITLADLTKVVNDLGWSPEEVHIEGRISYPYPPTYRKFM